MATTKQKMMELAAKLGATVDIGSGRNFEVTASAPNGLHWKGDGLHQLVAQAVDAEPAELAWKDVLERMEGGLETCDPENPDCADNAE
jgi:hypothetical protein